MATVLIVDDDEGVRQCLTDMVTLFGHEVCAASGAEAALDLVKSGQEFDLLITDLQMHGLDGDGLIAALRQMGCRQPICVLTGRVLVQSVPGADSVLHKPIHLDELQAFIERHL